MLGKEPTRWRWLRLSVRRLQRRHCIVRMRACMQPDQSQCLKATRAGTAIAFAESMNAAEQVFSSWYCGCQIGCSSDIFSSTVVVPRQQQNTEQLNPGGCLQQFRLCSSVVGDSTVNVHTATCAKRNDRNNVIRRRRQSALRC
jgi:hypothetical protein